ncbi:Aurovertin biosynthesis cluster transcription factor aurF [Metarhizium anisopliae]
MATEEMFGPSLIAFSEANTCTETTSAQATLVDACDPLHGLFDALQQFLAQNNVMFVQNFTIDMAKSSDQDGCAGDVLTLNAQVLSLGGTGSIDHLSPANSQLVMDAAVSSTCGSLSDTTWNTYVATGDALATSEMTSHQSSPDVSMALAGGRDVSSHLDPFTWDSSEGHFALSVPTLTPIPVSTPDAHSDDGTYLPPRASIQVIRADYLTYLATELPRWTQTGLWGAKATAPQSTGNNNNSQFRDLERAYSAICMLDRRISDDTICKRRALIELHREYTRALWTRGDKTTTTTGAPRRVGRGHATPIIDRILRAAHGNWKSLDESQRKTLRARFHNSKRYGKRWMLLTEKLGRGILLLCSPKLAKMLVEIESIMLMRAKPGDYSFNSKFTLQLLDAVATQASSVDATRFILDSVCGLADNLCSGGVFTQREADQLLARLRAG